MKTRPNFARLNDVLRYEGGIVYWRKRPSKKSVRAVVGSEAGCIHHDGYRYIQLDECLIQTHQIVWALHHSDYPSCFVDHINGNRSDNRIENLRLATAGENSTNRASAKGSTSGYLGVHFRTDCKLWRAQLSNRGKRIHLGLFDNEIAAAQAYNEAAIQLHGQFARLNQIDGSAA